MLSSFNIPTECSIYDYPPSCDGLIPDCSLIFYVSDVVKTLMMQLSTVLYMEATKQNSEQLSALR